MNALWAFASVPIEGAWIAVLVFLRVGAMMAVLPVFGEQVVPVRVKLGLTFAFTLITFPAIADKAPTTPPGFLGTLGQSGAEILTGLLFGLVLRLFIMALQIAGTIAAQSTSLSQIFGATAGVDPMPAIGNVLVIGGLALAALMGLHVQLASFIINSYKLVPAGTPPGSGAVAEIGVREVSRCFSLAFSLAAPFVVASLIYNIILGVINRAMPQLMVAFVGAPAITAGGLALLMLAAPILLQIWHGQFTDALSAPFGPLP